MEPVTLQGECPVCGKTFQASYVPEEGNVVSIKGYQIDVARRKIWGDMESHMIMHDENEYLTEQDTWEEKAGKKLKDLGPYTTNLEDK